MNAKEYLMQYKKSRARIVRLRKDIQQLHDQAAGLTAMQYDRDRVQSSHDPDRMGAVIARMADLEEEWSAEIYRAVVLMGEIERTVGKVRKTEYQTLLHMRYIEDYKGKADMTPDERAARQTTWNTISHEMHYVEQWVLRLHNKALEEVEVIINGIPEAVPDKAEGWNGSTGDAPEAEPVLREDGSVEET